MAIEHSLNQPLANTMQQTLLTSIFVDSNAGDRMAELLSEDPAVAQKRERLESKKIRLLEIQAKLNDFRI
jgi:vacuolar protein sorting-associated protein 1